MKKCLGLAGTLAVFVLILVPCGIVYAAPSDIGTVMANPSSTSIVLTWIKAGGSNNTLVRYRTDTFPANTADGIQAYFSTASHVTVGANVTGDTHAAGDNVSALTAGQAYYFSVWGESAGSYSPTPFHLVMSTLAVPIASGATDQPANTLPVPTLPAVINQTPATGAFQLEPFTSIVNWFNNAPGGFGMPNAYAWESLVLLGVVGAGFATYTKVRNFFVAYAVVFVLTLFGIGAHLVQGWLLGVEIAVGAGVWGIEHYLQ